MVSHNGIPDLAYVVPVQNNDDSIRTCWDGTICKFDEDGTLMPCKECPNRERKE